MAEDNKAFVLNVSTWPLFPRWTLYSVHPLLTVRVLKPLLLWEDVTKQFPSLMHTFPSLSHLCYRPQWSAFWEFLFL
jgi:hypothetical protein